MRSSKPPLQDEYGVVLMCALSIEWIWVKIYGKREEKTQFLGIFEGWYRYQTEWYRYHKCSVNYFGPVFVLWP